MIKKFSLGLCVAKIGNRIYHVEKDNDSFFISKDFCPTGIPLLKQIEEVKICNKNEFKLNDTFLINGEWKNQSEHCLTSGTSLEEVKDDFELAEGTLFWDNDELNLKLNNKFYKNSSNEFNLNDESNTELNGKFYSNLINEF